MAPPYHRVFSIAISLSFLSEQFLELFEVFVCCLFVSLGFWLIGVFVLVWFFSPLGAFCGFE